MKKIALAAILLLSQISSAQQVRPANSAQIYHEIAQLKNLVNVLYLAAHPDDENTRLLAWMVNDQHIRTAYLSLTRGDGGQNILGTEQGAALGYIRTHELMEARKLDGAEQFFTRAIDFGFSKNSEETFKHWNKDLLTGDVVWIYRKYRPDIVICRFPPTAQAGHGQHAASAILAAEAYKVSGDKTKYAQQLEHYKAWQPKRLLFNAFRFGSANTTSEDMFKLPVGQYSPAIGMGYGELAGISRSIHRSQGAGTPSTPGVQTEYFKVVAGDSINKSLFDGIDITWNRVSRPEIGDDIQDILDAYNFNHPEKSLKALLKLRKEIETVKNKYWRTEKLEELDRVILHCAGILAEAYTRNPEATRGELIPVTLRVVSRAGMPVRITNIRWLNLDNEVDSTLKNDTIYSIDKTIQIPMNAALTEPYWLQQPSKDNAHFEIPNDTLLGYPETPNTLNVTVSVVIGDETFTIPVPVSYKKLDPTHGDVVEQLRIVPDASVEFVSGNTIANINSIASVTAKVHAFKDINNAELILNSTNTPINTTAVNVNKGLDTLVKTEVIPAINVNPILDFSLRAHLNSGKTDENLTQHIIKYDHIPTLQYFTTAETKVLHPNWQCAVKRIAYINGAGDNIAAILRLTGLEVDELKETDINIAKLKQYDAILVGIRAINTEKRMLNWMHTLLQYVKNGGTLVMQYNTLQDMSTTDIGPYPITLANLRVTEEDAKVNLIDAKHKILNHPNKITDEDFKDWVQERGLYFASKWDEHYKPLFRMNDTGEQPLDGCTLYTQYGKGHYIYTTLSFFRQLPAGNKGAIRLLMNMLSVGK
ncbi:MAG: PIG-L family deacetylase [Bacteroidetes bacterium]|nr:PIG-L family deacetylase [Bacteroidota bacterium]